MVVIVIPHLLRRIELFSNYDSIFHGFSKLTVSFSILLIGMGLVLFSSCLLYFHKIGKGTLAPWSPTQNLVVSGPYKYVRNPMISSVVMLLSGQALLFHSVSNLGWAMLFICINHIYFKYKEEPLLEKKFGEDYLNYKARVNRWLPTVPK